MANILRITGHLCAEFTGHRWIPRTTASDAELWGFYDLRLNERLSKQWWSWWYETPSRPLCLMIKYSRVTWKVVVNVTADQIGNNHRPNITFSQICNVRCPDMKQSFRYVTFTAQICNLQHPPIQKTCKYIPTDCNLFVHSMNIFHISHTHIRYYDFRMVNCVVLGKCYISGRFELQIWTNHP